MNVGVSPWRVWRQESGRLWVEPVVSEGGREVRWSTRELRTGARTAESLRKSRLPGHLGHQIPDFRRRSGVGGEQLWKTGLRGGSDAFTYSSSLVGSV